MLPETTQEDDHESDIDTDPFLYDTMTATVSTASLMAVPACGAIIDGLSAYTPVIK